MPGSLDILQLPGFLIRSGYPNLVLDAAPDEEGHALVEQIGVLRNELLLVACPGGALFRQPSDAQLVACPGMTPALDKRRRI